MKTARKTNSGLRKFTRVFKWLIPLVLIVGLVALAFIPKPIEVDVGEVRRGIMTLTVDDDGETRVRERYTISTPITGRLIRIDFDPGDSIKKDDILAIITPGAPNLLDPRAKAQAQAMVKASEAAVSGAETQLHARETEAKQLEKSFLRNQILHTNGNVSDAVFEQIEGSHLAAQHARRAAVSAVLVAKYEHEQAEAALLHFDTDNTVSKDNLIIKSPIDGQVLRVHEKSSRSLQSGTLLLEVGNSQDLEMRIDVLSQDAVRIKAGQKVIIRHWGGQNELHGRVRLVEPSAYTKVSALGVDEQRVNIIADFEQSGFQALGDGYRIEAGIITWEANEVLQVPAGALFRQGENWAVYKIDGKHTRLTTIKIGHNNGDTAEVLSGLTSEDCVILHPGDSIKDGTLIKPRS